MSRKTTILLVLLLAIAGVTAGLACSNYADRQEIAKRAQADLAECSKLAARIQAIQARPQLASDKPRQAAETTGMIEAAAKSAKIPAGKLVRISPGPARRLGDSPYKEKPTEVFLKNVTMKQVVAFLHDLTGPAGGLTARTLRLSSPSARDTGNLWSVDLELTYLIYDPPRGDNLGARSL